MGIVAKDGNEVRVGNPERDRAIALLGEHLAAGRLDVAEFDDRCARVAAARYWSDIRPLFDDLPDPRPVDTPSEKQPARSYGGLVVGLSALVLVALAIVVKQPLLLLLVLGGAVFWWTGRRG